MRFDSEIVDLWLYGKAELTQKNYRSDYDQFRMLIEKPLPAIGLEDLQQFAKHLKARGLKETSQARKIKAIKSLLAFAAAQAHIQFDVGAGIKLGTVTPTLAGRILSKEAVSALIENAPVGVERVFLAVLYALALRISEACNLKWEDFTGQSTGRMQVMIRGKGGKLAPLVVPQKLWELLLSIRTETRPFNFDRRSGHDIVKRAVTRAGLNPKISAHWLRHAHARHAVEAGAPIHVVRDTLRHSSIATTNWYLESFPDQTSSDYLGEY
jgi:integrase/recombinase XerD